MVHAHWSFDEDPYVLLPHKLSQSICIYTLILLPNKLMKILSLYLNYNINIIIICYNT